MVSDRERLEALHKSDRRNGKIYIMLLAGCIFAIIAVTVWVNWPGERVSVKGEPSLVGGSEIKQGGIVTWVRQEVCVPEGKTKVHRYAEQLNELDPRLQIEQDVPGFTITASEPVCFNPSYTPLTLPNYIGPGEWRIRVFTETDNNRGGTETRESFSPNFTVVP